MLKNKLFTNKISVVALALLVSLLWGSLFPMIKIGYRAFSIDTANVASIIMFAGLRFLVSGILLVAALGVQKKGFPAPEKGSFQAIFVVSMLTVVLHYIFTYTGLSLADSSKSSVLKQVGFLILPCLIFLVRKDDKFSLRKVIAAILGFIAVISINLDGMSLAFGMGEILIIAASFTSAIGQVSAKGYYNRFSPSYIVAWGQLFGGALMFAGGLIFGGKFGAINGASLAVLAYICAASIAANLIWNTLIKYNNISTLAVLKSADPLFASIFSGLLLGENILNLQFLFALLLICFAIVLSNFMPNFKKVK